MKIQHTNIIETAPDSATVEMTIADHEDIEKASQYVACSVLISTAQENRPVSFRVLQTRALKAAIALLDQADDARQPQRP